MLEVEQKFRVDHFPDLADVFPDAHADSTCTEHDTYFAHPVRDFAATDEACRLRTIAGDFGHRHVLTYKGPRRAGDVKIRLEREASFADSELRENVVALLQDLGFRPVRDVYKQRVTHRVRVEGRDVIVTFDEVRDAGRFVEVEHLSEDAAAGQRVVSEVAAAIGLRHVEPRSYLAIVLEANG